MRNNKAPGQRHGRYYIATAGKHRLSLILGACSDYPEEIKQAKMIHDWLGKAIKYLEKNKSKVKNEK